MKFDDTDPPRLREGGDPELARLVRASRTRRLSSRTTEQMAKRLAATSAYAAAAHSATTRASLLAPGSSTKLGVLALVGVGAAILGWQAWSTEGPSPAPSHVPEQVALPPASPPEPPSPAPVETSSIPVEALPSTASALVIASASPRSVAPRRAPSALAQASGDAGTAPVRESEFALVRRAQDALASDPSRSLALVQEHARAFPAGELVQEREVVAVEALARLNRMPEAKARADALRALYPRTPYGARLDRALGGSGSPTLPSKTDH
ncbi:MAG: hypothetical protein BGO98_27295 [Myxococcales bacterium 68-20]|nr:hypothetical protein [Myxococcales bacterium]OJY30429.1 MAG: hypothetical protein BGO98_27295 [Myxococcales bacterium 68-20]